MTLWEYILTADRSADLADPARARDWLLGQDRLWYWPPPARLYWFPPDWLGVGRDGRKGWKGGVAPDGWSANVRALRRMGALSAGFRGRTPASPAAQALAICQRYAGQLVPVVYSPESGIPGSDGDVGVAIGTRLATGGLLAAELAPSPILEEGTGRGKLPKAAWMVTCLVEMFWQYAFGTLTFTGFPTVCRRCGMGLDLTPTGRPPSRDLCGDCRLPAWREEQGADAMRARWAEQKRRQRARLRRAGGPSAM
ncbi:MAG: hypothetical protein K2X82_14915 [Gemmataceae bacterium]|nr:hypothetical protein [Gemmataceae bacterium]